MSANARFEVFPMVLPEMGPRSVPDKIEFVANQTEELDLTQLIDNKWLDFISGVYVDNFGNTGTIEMICSGTNQRFVIAPDTAGYYPLLLPNSPKVMLTNTASETVTFQWYNIPVFPVIIKGATVASNTVDIVSVGGVPVVGGALAVTGPLTDAELRASAVPVTFPAPTITDYSAAMAGGDEEIVAAGQADNYFFIYNPIGNATVTINLAGGDASVSGFPLAAGGSYENTKGVSNAIHIDGTALENITVFAG